MAPIMSYPADLTDKVWQKKKGVIGKTKRTGVGEALLAMEKAFAQPTFVQALDPDKLLGKVVDPLAFVKTRPMALKVAGDQAKKIETAARDAEKKIFLAKATFASDKAVVAHLDVMAKALTRFRADLGKLPAALAKALDDTFRAAFAKSKTAGLLKSGVAASTEKSRVDVLAAIKQVEGVGTVAAIHATWGGNGPHRVLTTSCKMWDQIFAVECPQLTASLLKGKTVDEFGHRPWMWEVANENNNDATQKAQALADASSEARAITRLGLEYSRSVVEYARFSTALTQLAKVAAQYS